MLLYKLITIFFSILLLLQAYVLKKTSGSYLLPGSLFSLAWFFFSIIPLIMVYNVPVNPVGIIFIFILIFSFSLSSIPFNWKYAMEVNKKKESTLLSFNTELIRYIFYLSIVLSLIFSFYFVLSNGFSLELFVVDFIGTSARYAALRGNDYLEYGLLGTLSIFFTYFSALLGGVIAFFKTKGLVKLGTFFLSVLPSLFAMLTQSSKLIFFVAVVFYLSSTLLMKVFSGKYKLFSLSDSFKVIILSLIILPLLILAFVSREGYNNFDNSSEAVDLLLPTFNSYFFGSFYAFSDFFSYYLGIDSVCVYNIEYPNYGYYSFKSIFDTFGGTKVFPPGYYSDYYIYKDMLSTNIYSAFRGILQDFGFLGSIIFMFLFGLFFHYFFYKLLVGTKSWISCSIYIMFVGFLGISFLINIFTARYIFLLTFAFFILLSVNNYFFKKNLNN